MSRKTVIDAIKLLRIRHGVDVRAVVGNVYVHLYGRKVTTQDAPAKKENGVKHCGKRERCNNNTPLHLPRGFHFVIGANDGNVRFATRAAIVACAVALDTPPITFFGRRGGVGLVLLSPCFLHQGCRLKWRVEVLMRIHVAAASNAGCVLLGPGG